MCLNLITMFIDKEKMFTGILYMVDKAVQHSLLSDFTDLS